MWSFHVVVLQRTAKKCTKIYARAERLFLLIKPIVLRRCRYRRRRRCLSQRHTWRFYTPIAANLIASENRKRFSPPVDADTPGEFFRRSRRCGSFENSCDKIAQPNGLALLAIRSNKRRKTRERVHLATTDEFNRRYLTYQISANLYADRRDRRKSQLLHRAYLAIFADRGDQRIKSPSVSLALVIGPSTTFCMLQTEYRKPIWRLG